MAKKIPVGATWVGENALYRITIELHSRSGKYETWMYYVTCLDGSMPYARHGILASDWSTTYRGARDMAADFAMMGGDFRLMRRPD